jgi:hypothetical protein
MSRSRRPLALLAVLLAGSGLAACGSHADESSRVVRIENEGLYLPLGELKYQVQISRQLNPDDVQDKPLLAGIPEAQRALKPDEVWFGVFLQVENEASVPHNPSGDIEIIDTQDEVFKPLAIDDTNPFVYRSTQAIPAGAIAPLPDTPGYDTPIRGAMLLFKLTITALGNRPLELKIEGNDTPAQTGINNHHV